MTILHPPGIDPFEDIRARAVVDVPKWLAFMREKRLAICGFQVRQPMGDLSSFAIGMYCELLEARGCEIMSHSMQLVGDENGQLMAAYSLLVRAPRIAGVA